jgi:2-keto-3-deoxygluconate permease
MQIKKSIEKIPGGMMIVPLLIGSLIRTFFPDIFNLPEFKSSFTGGMLTGTLPLLAASYVCLGSTIQFNAAGYILKKGLALWAGKIVTTFIIGFLIKLLVVDQNHMILGLSALAIIAAFSDTNGGLYMALMSQFSRKSEDIAAYSIMSLESGPFFTMMILGVAGLATFPILAFVFALVPLIIGMILGNLDENLREFLGKGYNVLIPLFALPLGAGIDLTQVVKAGTSGIFLGVLVVIITGTVLYSLDCLTGGNGVAGVAASSTAGNAAAVPLVIAAVYPAYAEVAQAATVQVAACVIVTAVLTPIWTAWLAKRKYASTNNSTNPVIE